MYIVIFIADGDDFPLCSIYPSEEAFKESWARWPKTEKQRIHVIERGTTKERCIRIVGQYNFQQQLLAIITSTEEHPHLSG